MRELQHRIIHELGSGGFGTVYKSRLMPFGRVIAVKVLHKGDQEDEQWEKSTDLAYKGEGTILPSLNHPHIIRAFHSQGWGTPQVEIFMDLMDGTLADLAWSLVRPYRALADTVLCQILQALDYLNGLGLVHRDVKPQNIFYTRPPRPFPGSTTPDSTMLLLRHHHFRLGDFGLCDSESAVSAALSPRGSYPYMAPELLATPRPRHAQSHKSDVWALYVTVLWTLNVRGLRRTMERTGVIGEVLADEVFYLDNGLQHLEGMAQVNPRHRASARRMLKTLGWKRPVE
ncbi:kinase-like protein [Parathielavia appendiculata]|uniref:non-specific serine/threonine protein kinase n=1 Tax=Parathielavia appendiculata TaxID=2587402 RepID=A0AAN6Z2P8_9PEZI|nr:kinase-like protein [Parathielavia appendiculata]